MKRSILILILSFTIQSLVAQKLGLVLSGGGAPGIAHIGIIKALEENNIPIDYITGTSIGAIIGGMYAMGMTPHEMTQAIKSDDFKNLLTGEADWKNLYFYHTTEQKPSIIDFKFKVNKDLPIDFKPKFLPTNLIPPHQMNFAFVPLCAQANAVIQGNFDKLFVPFRCVASDIYQKKAVVFKQGLLGDAIRASMTFPFMFKPIEIDNSLLFDGGIYNNFPVDVMQNDFKPEYIIGSVVAYNPPKPDRKDVMMQLQNMIIHRTNYSLPNTDGLLLDFDLKEFNTFDFSKVDELVKIGYDSTLAHLDEIKVRVSSRLSENELSAKRSLFKSQFPYLIFRHLIVNGIDSLQKEFVRGFFDSNKNAFDLNEFRESYYKIISDDAVLEVIPQAIYNSESGVFDLNLKVDIENQLKVLFGANVSSINSNQAYFGLNYHSLTNKSQTTYVDAQIGQMYNGLTIGTRIEMSSQKKRYIKANLTLHKFNYANQNATAFFTQDEVFGKVHFGLPVAMNGRLEIGVGYGVLSDNYNQKGFLGNTASFSANSKFYMGSMFGNIETNTLNNLMHPTKGFNYSSQLQFFGGQEVYKSIINPDENGIGEMDKWFQYRVKMDHYFPLNSRFTIGTCAEVNISTRKLLHNYTSAVIQAPNFRPTPYSRIVINDTFSANKFAAIGLKPLYHITNQLHIRSEVYWFVPYKSFVRAENNLPSYSTPFSSSQFMSETSLVLNFRMASASIFTNYIGSVGSKWNVGMNIGIQLFNPRFAD